MDPDGAEAVADVLIDAEDAADVHVRLERRLDRMQLDAAVLGDGRNAGGEAACEAGQHDLDRRRRLVLGGEDLGMVGVDGELFLVRLLGAQPEEVLDGRAAVRSVDPFDTSTRHLKLRRAGALLSASRAPRSAATLTPLLAVLLVDPMVIVVIWIFLFHVVQVQSLVVVQSRNRGQLLSWAVLLCSNWFPSLRLVPTVIRRRRD